MGDDLYDQGLLGGPLTPPLGQDAAPAGVFSDPLSTTTALTHPLEPTGSDGALARAHQLLADYAAQHLHEQPGDAGAALILGELGQPVPESGGDALWDHLAPPSAAAVRSLVVIDTHVANWRELVINAPAEAEVLVLDPNQDGVLQVGNYLKQQQQLHGSSYNSVAVVSETADGMIRLGSGSLNVDNIERYANTLNNWNSGLAKNADLLLFGSNVEASNIGKALTERLGLLTGAKITLSSDLTESSTLAPGENLNPETETSEVKNQPPWIGQNITTQQGHAPDPDFNSKTTGTDSLGAADLQATYNQTQSTPPDTTGTIESPDLSLITAQAKAEWTQAQQIITTKLKDFASQNQYFNTITEVFSQTTDNAAIFQAKAAKLQKAIQSGELRIAIELRSDREMNGLMAAYAATGHDGKERIYVNADWLNYGAGKDWITQVLLEELGHGIDQRLNGSKDTQGDEGNLFAARILDFQLSKEQLSLLRSKEDYGSIQIDGQTISIQHASLSFSNAYRMVYDINNSGAINGNLGETSASKEQNSHNFDITSLGTVSISDGSSGINFSGNDVSAVTTSIGGAVYNGWISRPIKSGGVVRGFYFWTDKDFTSLQQAQADGNQDGDGNESDNKGFILVVDQAWFTSLITASGATNTINLNNTFDNLVSGTARGSVTYANVGSSSDRVDSALNSVLPSNVAPVATADTATAIEAGGVTNGTAGTNPSGNVLTNDTDANSVSGTNYISGETKIVSAVGTSAANNTVTTSTTSASLNATTVIGQYGSLKIGADGSYVYTVDNTNTVVQALRTTANTLSDTFTYTVRDTAGATSTTTLTVTIQGANDTPVANPDYNTAKESTTVAGSTFASTGYSATGNVLTNDTDVDSGDGKTVQGVSVTGAATVGTVTISTGSKQLLFTGSGGFTSVNGGEELYVKINSTYYKVFAADGTTAIYVTGAGTVTANGTSLPLSGTPGGYKTSASSFTAFSTDFFQFFTTNRDVAFYDDKIQGNDPEEFIVTAGGTVKTATVSSTASSGFTTISTLSQVSGTISVGMTVSGTGVTSGTTVSSLTYTNGVLTSIKLDRELTSTAGGAFTFTGTSSLTQSMQGAHGSLSLSSSGAYTYTPRADSRSVTSSLVGVVGMG